MWTRSKLEAISNICVEDLEPQVKRSRAMGDLRGEGGVEGGRVNCRGTLDGEGHVRLVSPCSTLFQCNTADQETKRMGYCSSNNVSNRHCLTAS